MNGEDFIERLKGLRLPVFSLETAANIIQKPADYTSVYLGRLRGAGIVKMVERGKYYLPGTDDYTIASRIMPGSYITGYAALEHYKLTTQITSKLQVLAAQYHRPIKLSKYVVEFSKVKRDYIYGYVVESNGPVFAEVEKVFIDDLYLHGRQYYSEEFEYAMERGKIDKGKLYRYASMSGDHALEKKLKPLLGGRTAEVRQKVKV